MLAFVAQWWAERRGVPERERRRKEESMAEFAAWPRWKQLALLGAGVAVAVGCLVLALVDR